MEYCFFSPIDLLLVEIGKIAVMLIILKCNILFRRSVTSRKEFFLQEEVAIQYLSIT